jgi:GntR family transcriptional regulator
MGGYADIASHYREVIARGDLVPGDAMPSYTQAGDLHRVNRTTIVRAYDVLKNEGLIAAHPGKGTVVLRRPRIAPATGVARIERRENGGENYAPGETSTGHEAMMRSCADPKIAQDLGIDLHDEIVIRRRVFRQDGIPVVWAIESIHPRALAVVEDLLKQGTRGPVHWHVEYEGKTGRKIYRSPEMRAARFASADELKALEVAVPDSDVAVPVLVTQTVFHDENGPLEVMEDVHAPGTWNVAR